MKKQYTIPELSVIEVQNFSVLCLSNINSFSPEEEFAKERTNVSFADEEQDFLMETDW